MSDARLLPDVDALMREASARFVAPRFQDLDPDEIDTKSGPADLVTVADREAEAWLTPRLERLLPGSVVVGEEGVAADRSVLGRLDGDAPVWLVDPVDGTANFVEGSSRFGMMVALVRDGSPALGAIFAPVEGVMATAIAGEGAQMDGQALRGRTGIPFAEARGDYSSKYVEPPLRDRLTAAVDGCAAVRAGHCSAYAYLDTARGEVDFVLQYLMSPWDHAAGTLILTEAGGAARFLDDGSAYAPRQRGPRAMLAVGDAAMWDAYAEIVR